MENFRSFKSSVANIGFAFGVALFGYVADVSAAPVASGVRIVNVAGATYFNANLGVTETVYSNPVEAIVAEVPAIDVVGYSDLTLSRGAVDQHHFEIQNTGNTELALNAAMDTSQENGVLRNGTLFWDQDADGIIDDGEPRIDPTDEILLAMGESVSFIYSLNVNDDVAPGDIALSRLNVTPRSSTSDTEVAGSHEAFGRVVVVDGGLEILKSASRRVIEAGEELTYKIALRNNSESVISTYDAIDGDIIRVDGSEQRGVLVRDTVPLNTVFVDFGSSGEFQPLYHVQGQLEQDYQTALPATLADVDAVAFLLPQDYAVGRSTDLYFTVFVQDNLGDLIVHNTAETYQPNASGVDTIQSNTVTLRYSSEAGVSLDFVSPDTRESADYGINGSDTMLRLSAGACNVTLGADNVDITVTSRITGDTETISARETGPNTGLFYTTALPMASMVDPVFGDGVMATTDGDVLDSYTSCSGATVTDALIINPGNFVFNSVTNAPVEGALVRVVNSSGDVIAEATTDQLGFFTLGEVTAGTYSYSVTPPRDFAFPSSRLSFPNYDRQTDNEVSYGQAFRHAGGAMHVADIPLDPSYGVPLSLEKSADKDQVRTGEFVVYTIDATNNMDEALIGAEILDRLPAGAVYIAGSTLLDGQAWPDPIADGTGDYRFEIGTMLPLQERELTYVLSFTSQARVGRNYNTAILDGRQAGTGDYLSSNVASTYVTHDNSGGVFAREASIIGSVFMDCNGDGLRDGPEERGVPGVKIVTQSGLSVVTDIDGKYSLFGLRPVSHVLAVMADTLPVETEVTVTRTTDMRRGGSRLVPLTRGELQTENFALASCTPEALADVADRVTTFADRHSGDSNMISDLPMTPSRGDQRSARTEAGIATTTQIYTANRRAGATPAPELAEKARATSAIRQGLEPLMRSLTNEPGFIGLTDGQAMSRRTVNIQVKGPADLTLSVRVNGDTISAAQIGERSVLASENLQAMAYIAVPLSAGKNSVVLVGADPFGNERVREEITLTAPGDPSKIELIVPETASATPGSIVPVVVRILDEAGMPLDASSTVTLRARNATWDVTDIRDNQPGVQVYIDNGEATFGLRAPQTTGPDLIEVRSSFDNVEAEILFTPDLDERIMVGVIEGAVALNGRGDLIEENRISPFEDTATGLRGEVYLKGRILGDALLTLRYSSDKDTDDRLFRDIRGDEYYPVYGDNSERGFDAQSSGNLYVKIENGQSYVLYGDMAIEAESSAFRLGGYNRVATGAKAHWESNDVSVSVFAAHIAQQQQVREIAGRGISGPYDLDLDGYLEGSEKIEILIRDSETGDVLETFAQRRGTDYVLDFFRDAIVFNTPVAQADADGNPVSIRVTYETEGDDNDRYWLYGGEVSYQATEATKIGARVVHADADGVSAERERIRAVYTRTELSRASNVELELAQSENNAGDTGNAGRIAYEFDGAVSTLKIEATRTDEYFDPSGADTRADSDLVTIDFDRKLTRKTSVTTSARYLADRIADTETASLELTYNRKVNDRLSSSIGVRSNVDLSAAGQPTETYVLLGSTWQPESAPSLTFTSELEVPVEGGPVSTANLGANYRFGEGWTLGASVDIESNSQTNEDKVTNVQLSADYRIGELVSGYTNYTANGNDLERAQVVQGFRADWAMTEQLKLQANFEHTQPLDDDGSALTSLSVGASWEAEDRSWIVDMDVDQTFEDAGRTIYGDFGTAAQISPDLTFLARSRIGVDRRGDGPDHIRHRARVGVAYRPVDDARLNMLAWYEQQLEKREQTNTTHLWSIDGTYEAGETVKLNAKYAGQATEIKVGEGANTVNAETMTQLVQAGIEWDFGDDQWIAGLNLMHLWDDADSSTNAIGAELGYAFDEGAMLSLGYNKSIGRSPINSPLTQEGMYVRMRIMLDETLWDRLDQFGQK
ncbi:carboxypeptidase regulatory-like domain-containing protein [Yoonia maritima]|uniref:carboxypeptidase regulatory-like domain-containing protein n=1 Tax=Yoonia maritima TaxID=1435347 RepID=UPI000D101CE1|nr:carboxypeptidase regulatory-like domain-containing protein [Yoonia maritima]